MPDEASENKVGKPQHYTLRPTTVDVSTQTENAGETSETDISPANPFLRAPKEDDDGYDPFSDRREEPSLFERDPWG